MQNKNKTIGTFLQSVIFGTLLGDAFAQRVHTNGGVRIRFGQNGEKHKDYLYHLRYIFNDFTRSEVHVYHKKSFIQYSFQTLMAKEFDIFRTIFYPFNKKVVPLELYLEKYLDTIALSYWFMDDGAKASSTSKGYVFCTHNFTRSDVNRLCNFINKRFNFDCSVRVDRNYFLIYLPSNNRDRFLKLIKPHIHKCMEYKL